MSISSQPLSGFRDLLSEQMIPREEVLTSLRRVFENYGFVPLKTPALEKYEVVAGKYGEEGEKLMYKFEDNGGRKVVLRYDQTVPLARVVAHYSQQLPRPYKRYALGEVWRGESPQAGRYREFTQLDADTIGSTGYLADAEIIAMMADSMTVLDLKALIRVNDRNVLDGLSVACGISGDNEFKQLVGAIDKIDKIGHERVVQEVKEKFGEKVTETVAAYLRIGGDSLNRLAEIEKLLANSQAQQGIDNLRSIFTALRSASYGEDKVCFDQTIARGLDYYTGTIYETTLSDLPSIGSVCSGGRYDKLIENLGGAPTPAVGASVGVDRLLEAMNKLDKLKKSKTFTKVLVANLESELEPETFNICQELRNNGIAAEVSLTSNRLKNQLKSADKLGIRFVILYGGEEKKNAIVQIKDLASGSQEAVPINELARRVKELLN